MKTLNIHQIASDNYTIAGIEIRTRHIDANAIANINVCASRRHPIEVVVMVGPGYEPGWRNKDGTVAQAKRKEVLEDAAAHLGVRPEAIRLQARYSRLMPMPNGMILDRNTGGYYAQ